MVKVIKATMVQPVLEPSGGGLIPQNAGAKHGLLDGALGEKIASALLRTASRGTIRRIAHQGFGRGWRDGGDARRQGEVEQEGEAWCGRSSGHGADAGGGTARRAEQGRVAERKRRKDTGSAWRKGRATSIMAE